MKNTILLFWAMAPTVFGTLYDAGMPNPNDVATNAYNTPMRALITITLNARKNSVTTCSDPSAKGPLTGMYLQETGNRICLLDFEDIILIPRTDGYFGMFEAEFERHDPNLTQFGGQAFANGYSSGPIITPCHFNSSSQIRVLGENRILWTKPVFRYDNSCCNLISTRLEQEILRKVNG